jgi:hypothetical protein
MRAPALPHPYLIQSNVHTFLHPCSARLGTPYRYHHAIAGRCVLLGGLPLPPSSPGALVVQVAGVSAMASHVKPAWPTLFGPVSESACCLPAGATSLPFAKRTAHGSGSGGLPWRGSHSLSSLELASSAGGSVLGFARDLPCVGAGCPQAHASLELSGDGGGAAASASADAAIAAHQPHRRCEFGARQFRRVYAQRPHLVPGRSNRHQPPAAASGPIKFKCRGGARASGGCRARAAHQW